MADAPEMTVALHRCCAKDLFNHVWTLLEMTDRTVEQEDEMINAAHASAYHWSRVGKPENLARSAWQLSRIYAVLGRGEPARHHAGRCLSLCEDHGIGDWDLAFAHEALARAHRAAGDSEQARASLDRARAAATEINDDEDREHLMKELATISL